MKFKISFLINSTNSRDSTNIEECLHKCYLCSNHYFVSYQIDQITFVNKSYKKYKEWPNCISNHHFSINSPTSNEISNEILALNQHSGNEYQGYLYRGSDGQQSLEGCNSDLVLTFPHPLESAIYFISSSLFDSLLHSPIRAQYNNKRGKRREKDKEKCKQNKKYWNLLIIIHSFSEGTLTISGDGNMTDYTDSNSTRWGVNATSITKVIIKDPITFVGSYSFDSFYTKIESVEIAKTVLKINQYAFRNCLNLASLNLSNNLTQLEGYAFASCTGLTSLNLPNSLTQIKQYAFATCTGLASLNLPNNLPIISDYCFAGCFGLSSLIIPVGVTTIQKYAFYFCDRLESVNISHTVTTIGNNVFYYCSWLTNVSYCGTADPGSNASDVFLFANVDKVRVSTNYGSGNTFCGKPIEIGVPCIIIEMKSKTFSLTIKSKLSSSLRIDFYILMMIKRHSGLFLFQ